MAIFIIIVSSDLVSNKLPHIIELTMLLIVKCNVVVMILR